MRIGSNVETEMANDQNNLNLTVLSTPEARLFGKSGKRIYQYKGDF